MVSVIDNWLLILSLHFIFRDSQDLWQKIREIRPKYQKVAPESAKNEDVIDTNVIMEGDDDVVESGRKNWR